jgi:hypothetical protein
VCEEAAVWGVLLRFVDGDGVGVCSWEGGVSDGVTVFSKEMLMHVPPTSTPMRMHLLLAVGDVMMCSYGFLDWLLFQHKSHGQSKGL